MYVFTARGFPLLILKQPMKSQLRQESSIHIPHVPGETHTERERDSDEREGGRERGGASLDTCKFMYMYVEDMDLECPLTMNTITNTSL